MNTTPCGYDCVGTWCAECVHAPEEYRKAGGFEGEPFNNFESRAAKCSLAEERGITPHNFDPVTGDCDCPLFPCKEEEN